MSVPTGWKRIHDTRNGDLVYVYPDGSEIIVTKEELRAELLSEESNAQPSVS